MENLEEVRKLAKTQCDVPDLKNASLFSCLTGLRISDILALTWSNIEKAQDGGWCIRIRTEKTDTEATLPPYGRGLQALRQSVNAGISSLS